MASPLPDPFHPTPCLFPSPARTKSTYTSRKPTKVNSMFTATREPSPGGRSRSQSRESSHPRSPSPVNMEGNNKNPLSAPPTWRSKFAKVKQPMRRSNLKISSPILISSPKPSNKRDSTASDTDSDSTISDISLASSTVSYGRAEVVEVLRPTERPKLVDARSPLTTHSGQVTRLGPANSRKLLQHFGVSKSDREHVALQRAGITPVRRMSAFREEFSSEQEVHRKSGEEDLRTAASKADGARRVSEEELSEGMVKWFRCDIFPTDAPAFHSAEAEAKRLVVEGGGKVMGQWTYPGGFMFQIARNLPAPLPPTIPSTTPTRAAKILLSYLGEDGSLRVTEFQPHLDPLQHLLSLSTYTSLSAPNTPNSGTSSNGTIRPTSKNDDLLSAMEYITSASVEEIPLLRTSPGKAGHTPPLKQRESWQSSMAASPEAKGKLQLWLQKQQGSLQAKKKREGQVYDFSGRHTAAMLRRIEEEEGDEDDWESDYEDGKESADGSEGGSGSEFSIATGLESVKFVAECGSLF